MSPEEIKFWNDKVQDTRYESMMITKYHILVDFILNNTQLNWDKTSLTYRVEEPLYTLIRSLESDKYFTRLRELQDEEKSDKTDILKQLQD